MEPRHHREAPVYEDAFEPVEDAMGSGVDGNLRLVVDTNEQDLDLVHTVVFDKEDETQITPTRPLWSKVGVVLFCLSVCAVATVFEVRRLEFTPDSNPSSNSIEKEKAARFLGSGCNVLDGAGCNPTQLMYATPAAYTPASMHWVGVDSASIMTQTTGYLIKDCFTSLDTSMWATSENTAKSFGVDVNFGGRVGGVYGFMFGGSRSYQEAQSVMYRDTSQRQYFGAGLSIRYSVFRAYIAPTATLAPSSTLATLIGNLPVDLETEADRIAYYDFFSTHPNSFVSSIEYGGTLKFNAMFSNASSASFAHDSKNTQLSAALWGVFSGIVEGLPVTLEADMGFNWSKFASHAQMNSLKQSSSKQNVFVVGGTPYLYNNVTAWLPTVEAKPAPIISKLSHIIELFPLEKKSNASTAWAQLLALCPHDSDNNICSNAGTCDFRSRNCTCIPSRENGPAGRCEWYKCTDSCGHGTCDTSTGVCKCEPNWHLCDCSARCGHVTLSESDHTPPLIDSGEKPNCGSGFPNDPWELYSDTQTCLPLDFCHGCNNQHDLKNNADCACKRQLWKSKTEPYLTAQAWINPATSAIDYSQAEQGWDHTLYPCGSFASANSTSLLTSVNSTSLVGGPQCMSHNADRGCKTVARLTCVWSDREVACDQPTPQTCPRSEQSRSPASSSV